MQHLPNTVEDQLLLKSIKEECPWENLPKRLQATLASKEEWHRRLPTVLDSLLRLVFPVSFWVLMFQQCNPYPGDHVINLNPPCHILPPSVPPSPHVLTHNDLALIWLLLPTDF